MKHLKYYFMAMASLCLASCLDDSDSGDTDYTYTMADLVDINVSDQKVVSIETDNGTKLNLPEGLSITAHHEQKDTTFRMMLYYSYSEKEPITVLGNQLATTIAPVEEGSAKTTKTDPVVLTSMWKMPKGKYINLNVGLKGSIDNVTLHKVAFVTDSVKAGENGTTKYYISMRHDQNGLIDYYTSTMYYSIPVNASATGDSIFVTANTYEGVKVVPFVID